MAAEQIAERIMAGTVTIEVASGNVEPILTAEKLYIKFDSEYMSVCSYTTEQLYLESIMATSKHAEEEIQEWKSLPKKVLQPRFEAMFNRYSPAQVSEDSTDRQGTLIVKVLRMDPHSHKKKLPYVGMEFTFLDAEGYFVARYNLMVPGSRENNVADRVGECYEKAAKAMAVELKKKLTLKKQER